MAGAGGEGSGAGTGTAAARTRPASPAPARRPRARRPGRSGGGVGARLGEVSVAPVCEWRRPLAGPSLAGPGRALRLFFPPEGGVSSSARVITPFRVGPAGTAIAGWAAGPGSRVPDWLGRSRLGRDEDRAGVLRLRPHP